MITKTITYVDYHGVERTEDFYFNLTPAELAEMSAESDGGLSEIINKISKEKNIKRLTRLFKKILLASYGDISEDGKRFIKNEKVLEEFTQSPAYSILFMELATDDKKAAEFINGVIPEELNNLEATQLQLTEKQKAARKAVKKNAND